MFDSERGDETRFWLTFFRRLQPAIACKQCQLIIDFATKLLACHAGGRGFEPRRTRHGINDLAFRMRYGYTGNWGAGTLFIRFCS